MRASNVDAKVFGDIRETEERERERGGGARGERGREIERLGKSELRTMRATCGCPEVHVRCKSCRLISRKTRGSGGRADRISARRDTSEHNSVAIKPNGRINYTLVSLVVQNSSTIRC